MITIPQTSLSVFPLCLGGNVFGWSANEAESFQVLDAFVKEGGNFLDTADVYSEWKEGKFLGHSIGAVLAGKQREWIRLLHWRSEYVQPSRP